MSGSGVGVTGEESTRSYLLIGLLDCFRSALAARWGGGLSCQERERVFDGWGTSSPVPPFTAGCSRSPLLPPLAKPFPICPRRPRIICSIGSEIGFVWRFHYSIYQHPSPQTSQRDLCITRTLFCLSRHPPSLSPVCAVEGLG